jgi:hypothetical protein
MFWLEVWEYLLPEQRKTFEQNPQVKYHMEVRRCLAQHLYYDPRVYDRYHYKLQLLQSSLRKQTHMYSTLTTPFVEELRDDMDDSESSDIILSAGVQPIPKLLGMFFRHYIEHPSTKASILSPVALNRFCNIQRSLLNRNLGKYTRGSPLLLPYPMLYCVHIDPLSNEVDSYIAVLWYGCTSDNNERNIYTIEKYASDDRRLLQPAAAEEFIVSKAVILMGVAAQHWMREATSVSEAFAKLAECYLD